MRQTCLDHGLAGRILTYASSEYLTQDDLIDLAAIQLGLFEQTTNYSGAQFCSRNVRQGPLEAAYCSSGCSDDYNLFHEETTSNE